MKKLPNILSLIRLLLSPLLVLVHPFSILFFIIYIVCGLSDILDGYIARKFNICSKLGAALDSIADFILVLVVLIIFIPILNLPLKICFWIISIGLIRILALFIYFYKYNTLYFLHTYLNKITSFLLFLLPLSYSIIDLLPTIILICIVATIASLEELFIIIIQSEINPNIKSIFFNIKH